MKRTVTYAHFQSAITAPSASIGGEKSLSINKQIGIKMFTGEEPGFLTVYFKDSYVGIPLMNVCSLVWEDTKELQPTHRLSA